MDFLIRPQEFEGQIKKFLATMKERGYSEITLKSYQSFLRKTCSFVEQNGALNYTKEYSEMFLTDILLGLPLSESYKKHTRTAVRRFNEYLCDSPYAYRQPKGGVEPPAVFRKTLECYLMEMADRGLKPATIDCRRIFATQFLNSIEAQGVNSIEGIAASHVGTAVLCAGSMEGICKKLPYFLKYLYCSGLTKKDFSKVVPPFLPDRKLPTVYKKEELRNVLEGIDCNSVTGKRDYAILLMLATYGIRATDLVCLKVGNIDFQHDCFSFIQSKTGNEYRATLLPAVKGALLCYLAEAASVHSQSPLFRRVLVPCGALSRSAVWSIVASRLKCSVVINGRKRGAHAIRSSMASGLIADDVPYTVVQKVLGHTDPNATKRYASIDIERLRKCALECPEATGHFASYLEGGAWK
jgi:site-specific recombinase XerD